MAVKGEQAKRWGTTVTVVAVLVALWSGVRYVLAPPPAQKNGSTGPNGLPGNVLVRQNRAAFIGYDANTKPLWTLRADVVDATTDKMRIEARGHVEAELLEPTTGKRRAFVTAPSAVFSRGSNTLQIGGKIVCRAPGNSKTDLRIEAETLIWNVGTKQVLCTGAVHADLPNGSGTVDGRDLTLQLTTRELSMKTVRASALLKPGDGDAPPALTNPLKGLPF